MKDKAAAGCMTALMIVVFLGLGAAVPGIWMIVVAIVVAMLAWEMFKLNKIDNPSPPPPKPVVETEETQVTDLGNGAGLIVYPPGHVRRYDA